MKVKPVGPVAGTQWMMCHNGKQHFLRKVKDIGDPNKEIEDVYVFHPDMLIEIKDTDAYMWYGKNGKSYIDVSPKSLGFKEEA